MKSLVPLLFLGVLSFSSAANTYPMTVSDDITKVTITQKPNRIIAGHPIALEMLLSLGVEPVGYVVASPGIKLGDPIKEVPKYKDLMKTEPTFVGNPLNVETVTSLNPDLIVAYAYGNVENEGQIRRIAPTLFFKFAEYNGWQRAILPLGKALGKEKRAQEILNNVKRQENQARILLAPAVKSGKKIVVYGVIGKDIVAFGNIFPASQTLQKLGFDVQEVVEGTWKPVSSETILTTRADRALLLIYNAQPDALKTATELLNHGQYKHVYTLEPDKVARFTAGPISDIQMLNKLAILLNTSGK